MIGIDTGAMGFAVLNPSIDDTLTVFQSTWAETQ
jgi:hypothetical protein